jgi:hypothetical protein
MDHPCGMPRLGMEILTISYLKKCAQACMRTLPKNQRLSKFGISSSSCTLSKLSNSALNSTENPPAKYKTVSSFLNWKSKF